MHRHLPCGIKYKPSNFLAIDCFDRDAHEDFGSPLLLSVQDHKEAAELGRGGLSQVKSIFILSSITQVNVVAAAFSVEPLRLFSSSGVSRKVWVVFFPR